jgi:drug/metabolite transporter (DMT)-like permease
MGFLLALCAIWGLTPVTIKVANAEVSPLLHAGVRSALSALLLWGWCALRGIRLLDRDGSLGYGVIIGTLFAAEFALLFGSLLHTTAARNTLYIYTAPFVVAAGAHWLLPGERLTRVKTLGLVCAFTGLALAFADGLRLPTRRELLGDVMALGAAVLWGATTLVIKAHPRRVGPHKTLFHQLVVSAVLLTAGSLVSGEARVGALTAPVLAAVAYQVVVVAFVSFLAWFWLLARYPASNVTAFTFWTPIFGMLAGWLLLAEPVSPALAVSILLVAAGIWTVNQRG